MLTTTRFKYKSEFNVIVKSKPSKIELEDIYLKDKLSYKELAKRFLVSGSTIGEWLKSYNIPIRRFGEGKMSKSVVKPSKEELENLYVTQKLSVMKIAKKIGVAEDTIKHWIISYGLEYKAKGPRKKLIGITKNDLIQLYSIQKLSTRQIANKYNTTKTVITYWLRKYNIPIRNSKTFNWEVRGISPPSKEQLEEDYKTLSVELIAKKYGFSTEPILLLLDRYDIQKRNRSESKRLAEKTGRFVSWNKGKSIDDPKVAEMVKNLHEKHMEKIIEAKTKQAKTRKRLFAEGTLKSWNKGKTGVYSEETINKIREARSRQRITQKNTKPEILMRELLKKENLTEGLVEQYSLKIGKILTIPDFVYPEHKLAIYCDGEFWHGGFHHINQSFDKMKEGRIKEGIKKTMKKDEQVHYMLWENGWVPLRFWQHDIEENPKWVIEQIKKNLFDKRDGGLDVKTRQV